MNTRRYRGPVGKDSTGPSTGASSGAVHLLRLSTTISRPHQSYVGEGPLHGRSLETFGGYGVVEIPNYQGLLAYICENGFEHHVSINQAQVASVIHEAFTKYLGWDVYYHRG